MARETGHTAPQATAWKIPTWLPPAALARSNARRSAPGTTLPECDLLHRLAIYPAMKGDVWEKLPSEPSAREGDIIDQVILACQCANSISPRWPKKNEEVLEYLQRYPIPISFDGLAIHARTLAEHTAPLHFGDSWTDFWPGDPKITPSMLVDLLSATANFYDRLAVESARVLAAAALPPIPHKRNSRTMRETYFGRAMSDFFKSTYGKPLDEVVAALTVVAFDLRDGPDSATIRGRRRSS